MTRPLLLLASLLFAPFACSSDDKNDDDSNGDSNDSSGQGGSASNTNAQTQTTSTMETCMSDHECINGACQCTTAGAAMKPCTDDAKCEDECEVCM